MLGELRRRKVFQVAAVYALVAWLLIQVIGEISEPLQLPDWLDTVVIVLLGVGFPIALLLAWAFDLAPKSTGDVPAEGRRIEVGHWFSYVSQGLVLLAVAYLVANQFLFDGSPGARPVNSGSDDLSRRFVIDLGPASLTRSGYSSIAISPDGRTLAYTLRKPDDAEAYLYTRNLDELHSTLVEGTEGAENPSFSNDGNWIIYAARDNLDKVSIRGGAPQRVDNTVLSTGSYWASDDNIYFTKSINSGRDLYRVASGGGTAEKLGLVRDEGILSHTWPQDLPGGAYLMFTMRPRASGASTGRIALYENATGDVRTIIELGYNARYVPTGHIVFMRSGSLWAVPFDIDTLEAMGTEVPVVTDVATGRGRGPASFAISSDGMLIYELSIDPEADNEDSLNIVWRGDDEEFITSVPWSSDVLGGPAISPDGRRLAAMNRDDGSIWIYDLERLTANRLAFGSGRALHPAWTPDGERIVFTSSGDLWWQPADGSGSAERLIDVDGQAEATDFTPDGRQLIFHVDEKDIYVVSLDALDDPQPLIDSDASEGWASLSPDGRWIAYMSDETGRNEIVVQPFPDVDAGKWQVSRNGGHKPIWRPDGKGIYYMTGSSGQVSMWTIEADTTDGFRYTEPTLLLFGNYRGSAGGIRDYDVSPLDHRLLLNKLVFDDDLIQTDDLHLVVIDNFFAELNRLAPSD